MKCSSKNGGMSTREGQWPQGQIGMPFHAKHGHLIPQGLMEWNPLTMMDLELGIQTMNKEAAGGLDGWAPGELALLPACLLHLP